MPMRPSVFALALFSAAAFAQTTDPVYNFVNINSTQDMNEVATLVRTIADIRSVAVDAAKRSMTLKATPDQMELVAWLMKRLDQPLAEQQNSDVNEYRTANHGESVVRLIYFTHGQDVRQFQEIVTAVRTVADIRRAFTYNTPRAAVLRGTEEQIGVGAWVAAQLDRPPDAVAKHAMLAEYRVPAASNDVTRVFQVANAASIQDFQEMATGIRTIANVRRVFTYNTSRLMVIRDTPDQMAIAQFLFDQLDRPAAMPPGGELRVTAYTSDDLVRVYARPSEGKALQGEATQIRNATGITRVFTYDARRALMLRGTADQLARAELILQQDH
jgi:type II secretory pathway component GspD/PulD (secretin)